MLSELAIKPGLSKLPYVPTFLAAGSVIASCIFLLPMLLPNPIGEGVFWLVVIAFMIMIAALWVWASRATALQDLAVFPIAGLAVLVGFAGMSKTTPPYSTFAQTYTETLEADFPFVVSLLLLLGAMVSMIAAWRSQQGGRLAVPFAVAAVLVAPTLAMVLELTWVPALTIGAPIWALHAVALAGLMVWFAAQFARTDQGPGLRTALATLAALSIIAYALSLVLTLAALTVGLAVMVVVAAALDRAFNLPQMQWFIFAGVATLGYRLLADPGLDWGVSASLLEVLLAYIGSLAALIAAYWLQSKQSRTEACTVLEGAVLSVAGLVVSLMIFRWVDSAGTMRGWGFGLYTAIWFGLAFVQGHRVMHLQRWRIVRRIFAGIFALLGLISLLVSVTLGNPLIDSWTMSQVIGWPVFNTLILSYLLPALVLAAGLWWLPMMRKLIHSSCAALSVLLAGLWVFSAIRHFWQGSAGMPLEDGVGQYELYTYTVVLLLVGAALFYQSLARSHLLMRRAGLIVIGLAVIKVFFIDISGLTGLTRVFSLLALGLALAGLAWLNRWAQTRDKVEPLDD